MQEGNDGSRSKLSAWIPKQIHKQAKILATARDIDLQELVTIALQDYLVEADLGRAGGTSRSPSEPDQQTNGENGNG